MRKIFITSIALAFIVFSCTQHENEQQENSNDGNVLFETVKTFVKLGEHRTATATDSATSAWLKSELDSIGATTQYTEFPVSQFFFNEGKLLYDDKSIEVFPVWPVKEGLHLSVSGIVVDDRKLKNISDVKGKLVLTHLQHVHGASNPLIVAQIDTFIKAGAIGVLAIPENNTGEIIALNTFENQKPWNAPVYEIAPKDTAIIYKAISDNKPVRIEIKGEVKNVTARNILAKIGSGKQYVVISTPISGWFRTGGERGPGIAIWLGLAKWAKENISQFPDYTFIFTGNSGHELNILGASAFLDKAAPKPEETKLWIHLGAAVAVKEWKEENGKWVLTDSVDSKRGIYYSSSLANSFETAFEHIQAKKVKGLEDNKDSIKPGGEGALYHEHGYNKLVSIAYAHRLHHVKTDDENTTSPELLLELEKALENFISLELKATK